MALIKHLPGKSFVKEFEQVSDYSRYEGRRPAKPKRDPRWSEATWARRWAAWEERVAEHKKRLAEHKEKLAANNVAKPKKMTWWRVLIAPASKSLGRDGAYLYLTDTEWRQQAKAAVRARWSTSYRVGTEPERWSAEAFNGKYYWVFGGKVFETTDADLTPEDVAALANEGAVESSRVVYDGPE